MFLPKLMTKRNAWACSFLLFYSILISLSCHFLKAVLSWYYELNSTTTLSPASSSLSSCWAAIYASVGLGMAFGVLSMVAAMAVAVPASLVIWITVLVLLSFLGKPRRDLIMEAKNLIVDIAGFVVRGLITEGNAVAAFCAVVGYFAIVRKGRVDDG